MLTLLPGRVRRRLAAERAQRRLERDFDALMATGRALRAAGDRAGGAPRLAVASFGSGSWHFVLEALLAHALRLRGAAPEFLMCDIPTLPVCDERTVLLRDPRVCHGCLPEKRRLLDASGLPWHGISKFIAPDSFERARTIVAGVSDRDLGAFAEGSWPLGKWIYVSACHFLRGDARGDDPRTVAVRRLFLETAILVVEAVRRWLDLVRPDIVVAESGAHFMWRIVFELARARGIRVVCREIGKGGWDQHIYSMNAECMFPDLADTWDADRRVPLTRGQTERVNAYLRTLPAKTYTSAPENGRIQDLSTDEAAFARDRKVAVLFTGVTWDLATAGRDVAFDGMFDWIGETLRLAATLPDVQIVIRAHPAEKSASTREHVLDRIAELRRDLPANVTLIPPDRAVSVERLCALADLVLTYCSTTGMEAAIYGKPVMVCGAPHYRNRGFTIDVASRAEYESRLRQWAAGALTHAAEECAEAARRYFHLFFFRYHIEMGWTTSPLEPPFRLTIEQMSELLPGRSRSVDAVCEAILNGTPILLPRPAA